jgi:hypothetical protein
VTYLFTIKMFNMAPTRFFGSFVGVLMLAFIVLFDSCSARAEPRSNRDHVAVSHVYLLHSSDFTLLNPAELWAGPAKASACGERPGTLVAAVVPEKIEIIRFTRPGSLVLTGLPSGRTSLRIYRAVSHAPPEKS